MLRIVHTADCHLDAPCASLDAGVRARVRAAEREAFARVCSLAIEREAHALVIAGDVFERSDVGPGRAAPRARAQVARDAGRNRRDRRQRQPRPGARARAAAQSGCTLALTHDPSSVELSGADGAVIGHVVAIGHAEAAEGANLAQLMPQAPEPGLDRRAARTGRRVGRARTLRALRARGSRPRLRLLGARPRARAPAACAAARLVPRVPLARDVGEPGAKGALVVEIDGAGRAEMEFVPLSPVRFERLRLDDVAATGLAGLAGRRCSALEATQPARPARNSSCVSTCAGARRSRSPARPGGAQQLRRGARALALGASAPRLRYERLRPPLDLDRHRGQPHLLGAALEIAGARRPDEALLDELAPGGARRRGLR